MKYSFPILTAALLALGLALLGGEGRSKLLLAVLGKGRGGEALNPLPDPDARVDDADPRSDRPEVDDGRGGDRAALSREQRPAIPRAGDTPSLEGQPLIAEAAQRVYGLPSLYADMRYRIDMFGHQLNGKGSYQQQGRGDVKLLRLEVILGAADQATSLLQICDGRFLWVRRDSPFEKSLRRTDLKEVRRAIEANPKLVAAGLANQWMALGGLPKLLQGLDKNYDFGPATADVYYNTPVWVVPGRMKRELLASILPNQRGPIMAGEQPNLAALPPQWPDRVVVRLGRDNILPLFPYNVEFLRTRPSKVKNEGEEGQGGEEIGDVTALVGIDLFDVQIGLEIDPGKFHYAEGNQTYLDNTQQFLQSLGVGGN